MARRDKDGADPAKPGKGAPGDLRLTARERDVLRLVIEGKGDAEIAHDLAISRRTVSWYVSELLARTGLPSRAALAVYAVRNNLLDLF
jgi:DNA-binding NarL/FixJ family response regulator